MSEPTPLIPKHPGRVASARRLNLTRWGEKRVVRLDELDDDDRALALALVDALKAHRAAIAKADLDRGTTP